MTVGFVVMCLLVLILLVLLLILWEIGRHWQGSARAWRKAYHSCEKDFYNLLGQIDKLEEELSYWKRRGSLKSSKTEKEK